MQDILKMIFYIFAFVAILYAAYYVSKFAASFTIGFSKSKYMKIIDKLMLTKDKSIVIVKVGGKNVLIGITNEGLKLMKELEEGDMVMLEDTGEDAQKSMNFTFKDILIKRMRVAKGAKLSKENSDES